MADSDSRPPARGDEAELFRSYHDELVRTVGRSVRASSPQTIEDACSFAWAKFMENQPDREQNWRGWLFRVAQFESWRLERERRDDIPMRTGDHEAHTWLMVDPHDQFATRDNVEDALSILERLPPRLRRVALLRALGVRPAEIGEITGDSKRRVHQLIARANAEVYEVLAERVHTAQPGSARAQRLWQLEHDQPDWLTDRIGRVPRSNRRSKVQSTARRAWRRAALALDDYRDAIGPKRFGAGLEAAPREVELRGFHDAARRSIDELERARGKAIGRGVDD